MFANLKYKSRSVTRLRRPMTLSSLKQLVPPLSYPHSKQTKSWFTLGGPIFYKQTMSWFPFGYPDWGNWRARREDTRMIFGTIDKERGDTRLTSRGNRRIFTRQRGIKNSDTQSTSEFLCLGFREALISFSCWQE